MDQRDGNVPGALRRAKQAIDTIDEERFSLYHSMDTGGGGSFQEPPLKTLVTNFVEALRRDPAAPFKNPFEYSYNNPWGTNRSPTFWIGQVPAGEGHEEEAEGCEVRQRVPDYRSRKTRHRAPGPWPWSWTCPSVRIA